MNLNALANGQTQAVNPNAPLSVRAATGVARDASHSPRPTYATPCALVGSIAGGVLTVESVGQGEPAVGQTITAGLTAPAVIYAPGEDPDTYLVRTAEEVPSGSDLTTELLVVGNVQPVVGWKDLQQLDALNVQGTRYKIYLYGRVEAIVRQTNRGGDLITDAAGRVYLVAMVFEHWPPTGEPRWCSVAATLQNGA